MNFQICTDNVIMIRRTIET